MRRFDKFIANIIRNSAITRNIPTPIATAPINTKLGIP